MNDIDPTRPVGEESRKTYRAKIENGFIRRYLSGPAILDIGYRGYLSDVVPIVPQAVGIELDYPGYDGRTLPFPEGSQNAVFASHCLEHIPDFQNAIRDWFRVLRTGGYLVVMVPHQFLYEKRIGLPSRYNEDHKRFYTPATLMGDIETSLPPNAYRVRHLIDNDAGFDYSIPPEKHAGGCYEIELVIEKIAMPAWGLDRPAPGRREEAPVEALQLAPSVKDVLPERHAGVQNIDVVQTDGSKLAVYDFGVQQTPHRRILVLKLDHFGDFIIGLPSLRQLRQIFRDDHITLICGSWNRAAALSAGLADTVLTYDYFPENALGWNGEPIESMERFRSLAASRFDLAVDLRVDEDTRHLLRHVDAAVRCGIGIRARHPYLDIILPLDHERRANALSPDVSNQLLGPEHFMSRMPVERPFYLETDFSVSNAHLIWGPYVKLPLGTFRATFALQVRGVPLALGRTKISIEVAAHTATIASKVFPADRLRGELGDELTLEFVNDDADCAYEFRVHAERRPLRATMRFGGVRLLQVGSVSKARLRSADLHIGEQLSLLVQLVSDRTRQLYSAAPDRRERADTRRELAPQAEKIVVMAPVSNSEIRDWPLDHYIALIRLFIARIPDCVVVLAGSRQQTGPINHVAEQVGRPDRLLNLAGKTAWSDLPRILRAADLVICNNSGIAHLAASSGAETLALYSGSHQPQEWGPRGAHARALMTVVPCSPCGFDRLADCPNGHACMQNMRPETVFREALARLDNKVPTDEPVAVA